MNADNDRNELSVHKGKTAICKMSLTCFNQQNCWRRGISCTIDQKIINFHILYQLKLMNSRLSAVWPMWNPWKSLPPKTVTLVIVTLTIFVKSQTKIVELHCHLQHFWRGSCTEVLSPLEIIVLMKRTGRLLKNTCFSDVIPLLSSSDRGCGWYSENLNGSCHCHTSDQT